MQASFESVSADYFDKVIHAKNDIEARELALQCQAGELAVARKCKFQMHHWVGRIYLIQDLDYAVAVILCSGSAVEGKAVLYQAEISRKKDSPSYRLWNDGKEDLKESAKIIAKLSSLRVGDQVSFSGTLRQLDGHLMHEWNNEPKGSATYDITLTAVDSLGSTAPK
jgi:hypothetical protein